MAAKGYKWHLGWIAENDSPGDKLSAEQLAGTLTVLLVADSFNKEPLDVANDVLEMRRVFATL